MDISEDLGSEDIMVQEMTTSTLIMPEVSRGGGGGGGGAGGAAGVGSGELGRRLLLAARHGDTPVVLDLMAKGAPFTSDWLGTSALHVAARGAHVETCGVLLRAGVSRDCRTKVERTPLHLAAAAGHEGVVSLLVEQRAAIDCRDMLRMTPLHWAAERGHVRVTELLLAAGADPLARSKFNKTPRDLATRRHHTEVLRLLEDAVRMREEAASCRELQAATAAAEADSLSSDIDMDGSQESKHRVQGTKPTPTQRPDPIKINLEKPLETSSAASLAAAAMLRRHGIALLPQDEGSTVLSALQSGRSVVLSDAGKLMLKESGEIPPHVMKRSPPPAPSPAPASKGVVLTATPVKSPPRQGVKIFTLNNKLLAMPKENKAPIKKVIHPHDSKQIQFIKLPSDAKITPSRSIPMKAKNKQVSPRSLASPSPSPTPSSVVTQLARPTVKLVMQRPAHNKLTSDNEMETSVSMDDSNVLFVPEEYLTNNSSKYLRTQLLTAHKTIAALTAQLNSYKTRLSKYENI